MSENERRGERSQERTSSPVRLNVFSGVRFFVVPNESMSYDAVLGRDSLNYFEVTMTTAGVKVRPYGSTDEMFSIVCDNEDNLDVSPRFSERVKAVILGYKLGMGKTILFTERERTSSLTKKNRTRTTILSFFVS